MKRKALACFISFIIIMSICVTASASTLADWYTDSTTRWNFGSPHYHLGAQTTTYSYASTTVKNTYSTNFNDGKAMWGTLAAMSELTSGGEGVVDAINDPNSSATATTTVTYGTTTNHISSWILRINSANFDSNTTEGKKRTCAHEIGHVYGLDHVSNTDQIMYGTYSTTKSVTDYDTWGIKVCMHKHEHDTTSVGKTYTSIDATNHKKRCTSCLAYFIEPHTWVNYGTYKQCYYCGYRVNN